ncbi:DUF1642 domain-containing protein [Lactococcus lactis]|uniref:DUF1642 domain-containing protein n=1 Tax=Lactococcus lactis TaxID=1358 RepID=UPI0009C10E16|nr:DUF1642 domain-containing protein [Lactococcus lactis]
MTKFEEEFKALTSWEWVNVDLIQQILTKFGNWHSDEEFQIVEEIGGSFALANKNLIDANTKLAEEIANLKSQLQQKALPVVPEYVAEWIEYVKEDGIFNVLALLDKDDMPEGVNEWLFLQSNDDNINLILRAWLDGYTVEKPQLFYLKNKLTASYLALDTNTGYYEHWGEEIIPKLLKKQGYKISFTQQEIDSMETRSYEQIAVPVEDGE